MKRLYFLFLLCLVASSLLADSVSVDPAKAVAQQFFAALEPATRSVPSQWRLVWDGEDGQTQNVYNPAFYVFNRQEGGFVIVAGDDISSPVIAYSRNGNFPVEERPVNLDLWMKHYRIELNKARELNATSEVEILDTWDNITVLAKRQTAEEKRLLETALWNQAKPFNNKCPSISGSKAMTGCVATAAAIIMKYHQWPDSGEGEHSYKDGFTNRKANFETPYQWDKMLNDYNGDYTTEEASAVATLMWHCGVLAEMSYGAYSSGAVTATLIENLMKHMKYNKGMQEIYREWYDMPTWNKVLRDELNDERPILYGGVTPSNAGHQFVVDGYEGDYFHVNWGWGGLANAFFLLTNLKPDTQGTGGSTIDEPYSMMQSAVVGMEKAGTAPKCKDILLFVIDKYDGVNYKGLTTTETNIQKGKPFSVQFGVMTNYMATKFDGTIEIRLEDKEGNSKEVLLNQDMVLNNYQTTTANAVAAVIDLTIEKSDIEPGDRIRTYAKSKGNSEWMLVGGRFGNRSQSKVEYASYEIIVKEDTGTGVEEVEPNESSFYIETDANRNITVIDMEEFDQISVYSTTGVLQKRFDVGSQQQITFSCSDCPPGIYILSLQSKQGVKHRKFMLL